MPNRKLSLTLIVSIASWNAVLVSPAHSQTGTEKVLYTFEGGSNAGGPAGPLVFDKSGNLYGTTEGGGGTCGSYTCGTIYKLEKSKSVWTESLVYTFSGGSDGFQSESGAVFDKLGNLYVVTGAGGNSGCYEGAGCGAVLELTPSDTGWNEQTLYTFNPSTDGGGSSSPLVLNDGNIYGVGRWGGIAGCYFGCGSVFELSPSGNSWVEKTLYLFQDGSDGANPFSDQMFYKGNLYGVTSPPSPYGLGGVFELKHSKGAWTDSTLYSFTGGNDGESPYAGTIFDRAGSIYGTTAFGGAYGYGTVFKMTLSGGVWTLTTLYAFTGAADGANPSTALTLDNSGNIYGTTSGGGAGYGVVFELVNSGTGTYSYNTIYSFAGSPDGQQPSSPVTRRGGKLYGTTYLGGAGYGVVYEITP